MSGRFNQLSIQTPEGVQFDYQLASPVVRFVALAIDIGIIWAIMTVVSLVVTLMQWVSYDLAVAFFILLYFVVNIGYFILSELVWRGQTLGKRTMKIRVMDAHGLKLQPSQLVMRNLLRFADSLPVLYFLGGSCALLNRKSQRLGDLAAGTVVVRIPELLPPKLNELTENLYNSFREYPRLEALLRQRVGAEPSRLALQALRRRDEMDAVVRARLYAEMAIYFRELVEFPESVTATLSDEQYLRNCVDSIYRMAK